MALQWLRRSTLVVADEAKSIDLSPLRYKFNIVLADKETPQAAYIRIYNVSDQTANQIHAEFSTVQINAGYEGGSFALIFDGVIKQVRQGKENATDSYLDIMAADGDPYINANIIGKSLAAGSTPDDRIKAATGDYPVGYKPDEVKGPTLPRGVVMHGMARDRLHVDAASAGLTYFIRNGKINFVPLDGARPDEAVVCNAQTGMIGWPEQTEEGIKVRMLLNPLLDVGCKLKIDNKSITQAARPASPLAPEANYQALFGQGGQVPLNADGLYRIYVIEHTGDTRGNDWYSDAVCISLGAGASPALITRYGF